MNTILILLFSLMTLFAYIMVIFAFLFYKRDTENKAMIIKIYGEVVDLIKNFREQMDSAIDSAIASHVKKYHH